MDKIEYRIIDSETKQWIYFVMKDLLINPNLFKNIDWKTLGQCLGSDYKDKNGKKIYSGDYLRIVSFFASDDKNYSDRFGIRGQIDYCEAGFEFFSIDLVDKRLDEKLGIVGQDLILKVLGENTGADIGHDQIDSNDLEIIGNNYNTPELNKLSV